MSRARGLLEAMLAAVLVAACSSGSPPTATPSRSATASPDVSPAASPSATTATMSAAPSSAVSVTQDVPYDAGGPLLEAASLDVYAPAGAGSWPLVVMAHGDPMTETKANLAEYARRVAEEGFVVFVPSWGQPTPAVTDWTGELMRATGAQVACAISFAAAQATRYGGDASRLVLFGQSAGAAVTAQTAFSRQAPDATCLAKTTLPPIAGLVTWEGDWLFAWDPGWDARFAADPSILAQSAIWSVVSRQKDLPVVMVVASDPGMPDLPVASLALRDPSGALRKQLEANGALADGAISDTESQELLYSLLKAQGEPVTLDVMPDSTHAAVSGAGWPVFLAAFPKVLSSE